MHDKYEKSCIRETLHFSTGADFFFAHFDTIWELFGTLLYIYLGHFCGMFWHILDFFWHFW